MKSWIYKIPHFKGKFRLVRLFFGKTLKNTKNCTLIGQHGLQYKIPNLKENIGFEIFADGIYEKDTSDLIISKLPPNGIFLDVGANIGSISLPVCRARPDVKVICVEASRFVFEYLEKNIYINNIKNCTLINKAISDQDHKTIAFYSSDMYGKGSFAASNIAHSENVKTITLDTLLEQLGFNHANLIKIDIEGFEISALKGALTILDSKNAPDIIFEFIDYAEKSNTGVPAGSAQKFLIDLGYRLYKIQKGGKLIFIPKPMQLGEAMLFATKRRNP